MEGRGLSWKETQEATKDRGIGDEPNNSTKCSEVADGVARQSEGIAQLSLLCPVRQGVPRRRDGFRLRMLQSEPRSSRSRRPNVCGHRRVRSEEVVGRTDARAEK